MPDVSLNNLQNTIRLFPPLLLPKATGMQKDNSTQRPNLFFCLKLKETLANSFLGFFTAKGGFKHVALLDDVVTFIFSLNIFYG